MKFLADTESGHVKKFSELGISEIILTQKTRNDADSQESKFLK